MALSPVQVQPKKPSGGKGGLFGKLAGGIAGAIGGSFLGQPLAGASVGAKIGGAVGNAIDPVKGGQQKRGVALAAQSDPDAQLAGLVEAQKELLQSTNISEPEKERANIEVFSPAIDALKRRKGIK